MRVGPRRVDARAARSTVHFRVKAYQTNTRLLLLLAGAVLIFMVMERV
jgi:hypothetical protein